LTVSKKVLVIEDDEVILVLISHILTRQSYLVHTTAAVTDADRLIHENQYDAILLEPKIAGGGASYIQRLESQNPALLSKLIVVTAGVHELPSIDKLPIHAVVRKPFEIAEFLDTVRRCVEM
jgi:DNA-binding NtrC family response regulator